VNTSNTTGYVLSPAAGDNARDLQEAALNVSTLHLFNSKTIDTKLLLPEYRFYRNLFCDTTGYTALTLPVPLETFASL
jgi:hypothetical protein